MIANIQKSVALMYGPLSRTGRFSGRDGTRGKVRIDSGTDEHQGRTPAKAWSHRAEGETMANRTYGISEVVGTATEGVDQAIRNGIERAGKSVRHLDWFEVEGIRGYIKEGQVHHFQVTMKLGYRMEDPA